MGFNYKRVLILGATSGIGRALAERFVSAGAFVIVTGRRQERLDEFVKANGSSKAIGIKFDISDLSSFPSFIKNVTDSYPDLDLIFLNAGIQRPLRFNQPETISIDVIQEELLTNYTAPVAFTKEILPWLLGRKSPATLLYTTSNLAIVPFAMCPNYSGSKAAMHAMILCIRAQLRETDVKVMELLPPAVQTELHGDGGADFGMPLNQFTDGAFKAIEEGKETIFVGDGPFESSDEVEAKRQEMFKAMNSLN